MRDNERPNQGWKLEDQHYLRKHDNAASNPDIQVITEDNLEEQDPELREYFCSICKGRLDYIKNMDMWYCEACVSYYDTHIQDVPIKNITDSRVGVYAELERYHQLDDNDIYSPFIEAINPDSESEEYIPGNVEVLEDDGRRKHIRVKGLPIEALVYSLLYSNIYFWYIPSLPLYETVFLQNNIKCSVSQILKHYHDDVSMNAFLN